MNYEFYDDMSMEDLMPFNNTVNDFNNEYSNFINNSSSNNYTGFDVLEGSTNYVNGKNNLNLYNPYEGYLRGNAYKDEYKPYKNYKVAKLNINSEKEEMMINIGQYSFMMHDLNLYLDVHPNDIDALNKFNEYRNKVNELITNYEGKYGPISVKGNILNNVPFAWEEKNWPWVK